MPGDYEPKQKKGAQSTLGGSGPFMISLFTQLQI